MWALIHDKGIKTLNSIFADAEVSGVRSVILDGGVHAGVHQLVHEFLRTMPEVIRGIAVAGSGRNFIEQWQNSILQTPDLNRIQLSQKLRQSSTVPSSGWSGGIWEFLSLVRTLSRHVPLILVIEDIRSREPLDFINDFQHELTGLPVMIVASGCSLPLPSPEWIKLEINPMSVSEIDSFLRKLTHRQQLPEFVDWLHSWSGGVQKFVIDILSTLSQRGFLRTGELITDYEQMDMENLIVQLSSSFESLSPELLELLTAVSCAGQFDVNTLRSVYSEKALRKLACLNLITVQGTSVSASGKLVTQAVSRMGVRCKKGIKMPEIVPDKEVSQPQNKPPIGEAGKLLSEARKACKNGDFGKATRLYAGVIAASQPGSVEHFMAALGLSRLALATGDLEKSNRYLAEALRSARLAGKEDYTRMAKALKLTLSDFEGYKLDMWGSLWSGFSEGHEGMAKTIRSLYSDVLFYRGLYEMRLMILQKERPTTDEERALRDANIAETLIEMFEIAEASPWLERAARFLLAIPMWRPVIERLNAQMALIKGKTDEASSWINSALQHYNEMSAIIGILKSTAIKGELLLKQGKVEGFESIKQAFELARSKGYRLLLPYILERGIRGTETISSGREQFEMVENYTRLLQELDALPRASWFLRSLTVPEVRQNLLNYPAICPVNNELIRLKLLGPFKIILPGSGVLMKIGSNKARQLLATVALSEIGHINTSTTHLATMLWPDMPPSRQIHNIHWLLTHIRKTLGTDVFKKDADQYRLRSDRIAADVIQFKKLIDTAEEHENAGRRVEAMKHYTRAISIVEGQPFSDVVYDAIEPLVQYIDRKIVEAYVKTARYYIDSFKPAKAIDVAAPGLIVEPFSIELREVLIEAYRALGESLLADRERQKLKETF